MTQVIRITLIGNFSRTLCDGLQQLAGFSLTCITGPGRADAISWLDRKALPSMVVLEYGDHWQAVLDELAAMPVTVRPALLAVIPAEDIQLLHHAMRSGARDYLVQPVELPALQAAIQKLAQEIAPRQTGSTTQTISVISCNSCVESAFLAANLAHIMALTTRRTATVIDLDLQLSSLPLFLDMTVEHSFQQALAAADTLDEDAIDAYLSKHVPGLSLLGSRADEIALPGEVSLEKTAKLISTVGRVADFVIINLPQLIDPLTTLAMERADLILVVAEQSLGSLNYGKGLLNILRNELEMPAEKIRLVVNHYQKKSQIHLQDIGKTLGIPPDIILPYDAGIRDNECYGVPLLGSARQSPVTRELIRLAETLANPATSCKSTGLLSRLLATVGGDRA